MQLKKDLTEHGPERARYWEAMKEIDNIKDFMRSEHYTEKEIEERCKNAFETNENLMRKYMLRMRMRLDQRKKIVPAVWNRWR